MNEAKLRLTVTVLREDLGARLELSDARGRPLAGHLAQLREGEAALWEGVLDTRRHVERYAETLLIDARRATAETLLARIGAFLGTRVLGGGIGAHLAGGTVGGTLDVGIDDADASPLGAVFAGVPWELARSGDGAPSLAELGYRVRVGITRAGDGPHTLPAPGEDVRVLLVFSEAQASRPLALRHERERLLATFYDGVMPWRRVHVDVLCHGVSASAVRRQVRSAGGYHVLHWSGHGRHDGLLLRGTGGTTETLSGAALALLLRDAGGFLPHVVFLNACLSGTLVGPRDWDELRASLARPGRRGRAAPVSIWDLLGVQPGHTGTALGLLSAGVPHVVAMRYEVGDAYACDLSTEFYGHLFGGERTPCAPDEALARARAELRRRRRAEHDPVDHVTPVLLGLGYAAPALDAPAGVSPALARRHPRPRPLMPGGRDFEQPRHFVGRAQDLARLREQWLETGHPAVALVQGLAGIGKTCLAAETVHLWHTRFDGVFCFQAKPVLGFEDFLRQLDHQLSLHSDAYHARIDANPYAHVYLPEDARIGGSRDDLLRDNLLAALRDERLLLVVDNFETLLDGQPGTGRYTCTDPRWDALLAHLARGLPGSGSRLLLTSRHKPAALAVPGECLWAALGPLPPEDALLLVQEHEALRQIFFSPDARVRALAERLLDTARGHPLILDRLARLAHEPAALERTLDALHAAGLSGLPSAFAPIDDEAREREYAYLEDAAARSIDVLIDRLTPAAATLLRLLTLALEPATAALLERVWSEVHLTPLPAEALGELAHAGLIQEVHPATWNSHELVRESVERRSRLRVADAPAEARRIWSAYGEHYMLAFGNVELGPAPGPGARERSAELGRRALAYLTRARSFEWLGSVASTLVTSAQTRDLLRGVIADLRAAADVADPGKPRWSTRAYLADALHNAGWSAEAMPFYVEACAEAEDAEHWTDVGWICHNWGAARADVGDTHSARELYRRSLAAKQRADGPALASLATWLELDRLALQRERVEDVLPRIEGHVQQTEDWWRRTQAGETVPEAPERVFLGRVLVSSLDATYEALRLLKRWEACLDVLDRLEHVKATLGDSRLSLARTRFNRYPCLIECRRLDEAQSVLEKCLDVFREAGDVPNEAATLSALSQVWEQRGDRQQALALERQCWAVTTTLPDLEQIGLAHAKLATLLVRSDAWDEALRHYLAAAIYDTLVGRRQGLLAVAHDLAILMEVARERGRECVLPSVAEAVARPEFARLASVLAAKELTPELLQPGIDRLVEQVREVTGLDESEPDDMQRLFGTASPALLGFPACVVQLDAAVLAALATVTGDLVGVWGEEPRVTAEGLPYVTPSVEGPAGDFALWGLPANQARVTSCVTYGSDAGRPTLLLSVHTPVALLRELELEERRHDPLDEHAWLAALGRHVEALGWACVSFDQPGREALFVVAHRRAAWIEALESRVRIAGGHVARPLHRDGRWLWPPRPPSGSTSETS